MKSFAIKKGEMTVGVKFSLVEDCRKSLVLKPHHNGNGLGNGGDDISERHNYSFQVCCTLFGGAALP